MGMLLMAGSAFGQETPSWFAASLLHLPDDVAEAAKEGKRVMLYFGQDGCPYCKQLMEVNFRQRPTVERMQKRFVALALNIWGDREVIWTDGKAITEKQLAARLKVQFTPTLIFLDEKGGVALRLNGYYPPGRFNATLDYVAGRISFADFQKIPSSSAANEKLNEQPFFVASNDLRRKKPLAVLFETTHCAECDELHKVSFQRKEVLEQLQRFDVVRFAFSSPIKIITPEGKETAASTWARSLKVAHVPTLVLFDERGREVLRLEAYFRPFHVAGALDYVASGAYRREPSFQRFLQSKADRMRERGATVDLWK